MYVLTHIYSIFTTTTNNEATATASPRNDYSSIRIAHEYLQNYTPHKLPYSWASKVELIAADQSSNITRKLAGWSVRLTPIMNERWKPKLSCNTLGLFYVRKFNKYGLFCVGKFNKYHYVHSLMML
jgi:hypothetical protein